MTQIGTQITIGTYPRFHSLALPTPHDHPFRTAVGIANTPSCSCSCGLGGERAVEVPSRLEAIRSHIRVCLWRGIGRRCLSDVWVGGEVREQDLSEGYDSPTAISW